MPTPNLYQNFERFNEMKRSTEICYIKINLSKLKINSKREWYSFD